MHWINRVLGAACREARLVSDHQLPDRLSAHPVFSYNKVSILIRIYILSGKQTNILIPFDEVLCPVLCGILTASRKKTN